jgi:hypothetical protein
MFSISQNKTKIEKPYQINKKKPTKLTKIKDFMFALLYPPKTTKEKLRIKYYMSHYKYINNKYIIYY